MRAGMLLLLLTALPLWAQGQENPWIEPPAVTDREFPVPQPDVVPRTPSANGSHPAYGIEWWYWVGQLEAVDGGEAFGFQATVFRLAAGAEAAPVPSSESFGEGQLYMAHAALSDFKAESYTHIERIYREGWQAKSAEGELDLRVGPISAVEAGQGGFALSVAYPGETRLELSLKPAKPLVSFGERGLSRKGSDPAAVSWYWTYPRLEVSGELKRGGEAVAVRGTAWMDHEISSSQLAGDLEGWDWTAIHLDDGTEVKAYRLRGEDGSMDPWSACYWIDASGKTRHVYADGFEWREKERWTSAETGLTYPTVVEIAAVDPGSGETRIYRLRPLMQDQEFRGKRAQNPYWEGACEVVDRSGRRIGSAYLELAGYGGGLASQLGEQ